MTVIFIVWELSRGLAICKYIYLATCGAHGLYFYHCSWLNYSLDISFPFNSFYSQIQPLFQYGVCAALRPCFLHLRLYPAIVMHMVSTSATAWFKLLSRCGFLFLSSNSRILSQHMLIVHRPHIGLYFAYTHYWPLAVCMVLCSGLC